MARESREEIHSVASPPAKDFFVNMLRRDFKLYDALLDN